MTAAIFYHPEAYSTSGPQLMGRNAAGQSFLRGFLRSRSQQEFALLVDDLNAVQHFEQKFASYIDGAKIEVISRANMERLGSKAVYYPGPQLEEPAWRREHFGSGLWSLCGITHTTSSAAAMDAIVSLMTAPVQCWDALICTSNSVQSNVGAVLAAEKEYLESRFAATKFTLPQMPVIPLGVDCDDFVATAEERLIARKNLRTTDDTLIVLYMGRLSFHAKAHPLAMYQALERASAETQKTVVLIECGWFINKHVEAAFAEAASSICPSIRVVRLDGRDDKQRSLAWSAADVFCSLSDNIQETFGITPIEAMAAGIPVVVSDWDGYRDSITDGREGFLIPTRMPPAGEGENLAFRHAIGLDSYDRYCGYTSSSVAVDIGKATDAFVALFQSAELRTKLGTCGKETARSRFDWSAVIPKYEELWAELGAMRARSPGQSDSAKLRPARLDPFASFSSYPTEILAHDTKVKLAAESVALAEIQLESIRELAMINFADTVIPSQEAAIHILSLLQFGPLTVREIQEQRAENPSSESCYRAIAWLAKVGLAEFT